MSVALAFAGCTPTRGKAETLGSLPRTSRVPLRSFSETQPYTGLALHGNHLYAGTPRGVVRFTLGSRASTRISAKSGLSGNRVSALAASSSSGVWVATEGGLSRYHKDVWTNRPLAGSLRSVTAMVATSAGVWCGSKSGIAYYDGAKWSSYLPGVKVRHLVGDQSGGGVWVATEGEGLYHFEKGKFVPHNVSRGQPLRAVRSLAYAMDGGLFAVGNLSADEGKIGDERLIYYDGRHWTIFRVAPGARLRWVSLVRGRVLLAAEAKGGQSRIFALKRADLSLRGPKKPPIGPLRLAGKRSSTAPSRYPVPYFYTIALELWLPSEATVVEGQGNMVMIGTRGTGAIVYDGKKSTWYRTNDLTGDTQRFKLACETPDACYLAGGGGRAYRFDGQRFARVSVDADANAKVLGFALDGSKKAVAVYRLGDKLVLSRHAGSLFQRVVELPIKTPHGAPGVRFARYAPSGELWIGLDYADKDHEVRPWGVIVIKRDNSYVMHRSSLLPTEDRKPGSLALPDDIRDAMFRKDAAWLATGNGVCFVKGTRVVLHTENEGMQSEITYSVAERDNGEILAATFGGLGRLVGGRWRFDLGNLRGHVTRAVATDKNVMFVGGDEGLLVLRGNERLSVRERDGLSSDQVRDLRIVGNALWVLTAGGISIIERPVNRR
ncbi:MAG: hypothetical protein KC503_09885 [Myxococcales bacterium]|nr:hypothetical protein [Myxococcales bacterium]